MLKLNSLVFMNGKAEACFFIPKKEQRKKLEMSRWATKMDVALWVSPTYNSFFIWGNEEHNEFFILCNEKDFPVVFALITGEYYDWEEIEAEVQRWANAADLQEP